MSDEWISVMDGLPEYHERVIVRYRNRVKHITSETFGYYSIYSHCWCTTDHKPFRSEVIAWRRIK